MAKKHKKSILLPAAVVAILLIGACIFILRSQTLTVTEPTRINLPKGASYSDLVDSLKAHDCLSNYATFHTVARLRGLPSHIKPGSYTLQPHASMILTVQKFYSGSQDPVRITINRHRTPESLCQYLGEKLDFEADSLLALLKSDSICANYGETPQTIIGMFPQNTYEVYWTVTPIGLLERMHRESEHFWNKHNHQLTKTGLTQQQVITIASIVEEETNCDAEKADIASVYLNRYRIDMPLQADPTVKFALGDFAIRRVTAEHLKVESPYNTYRVQGLPPGPICIPSVSSIDAVLHYAHHNYLYMCAKEDFSGSHNFAATYSEHMANAARYRNALDKRNIH